ncbi:hypothetical protein ABH944_008553 [Caballeronia udeis]|uniref:Uncharacterized protein n=1 Tax=Caballeronia udeis TaxID=1232866 RepID=A0ABW8MXL9_9BURK
MGRTVCIPEKLAVMLVVTIAASAAHGNQAITDVHNEVGLSIGGQNLASLESDGAPSWLPTGPDGYAPSRH